MHGKQSVVTLEQDSNYSQRWRSILPWCLAGGLGPDNLERVLAHVGACGVDLSSSLETGGYKDPEKIRQVMELVCG